MQQNRKMSNSVFSIYKTKSQNQRIALTGVMMSGVFILEFLSRYMPFGFGFLNFNFSTLFILPIFYFAGPWYGLSSLLVRLTIGPALVGDGYYPGIIGHIILLMATILYIVFLYLFSAFRINGAKGFVFTGTLSILCMSVIVTLLNAVLFFPWYMTALGFETNFNGVFNNSQDPKNFFGIHNYWLAIFSVYFTFNVVNYSVIHFVLYFLSKPIRFLY